MRGQSPIIIRRSRIGVSLIIVGFLAVVLFIQSRRQHEPTIDGRPISEWISDLGDSSTDRMANEKLVTFGAEGLPALVEAFESQKGIGAAIRGKIAKGGKTVRWWFGNIVPPEVMRNDIAMIISQIAHQYRFAERRPDVQYSVDALTRAMPTDPRTATFYIYLLSQFGEQAQSAIPTLMNFAVAGCPPRTGQMLVSAFAEIGTGSFGGEVTRFATNFLTSTNPGVRVCALRAIGGAGSPGQVAKPILIDLLKHDPVEKGVVYATLARLKDVPMELKPALATVLSEGKPEPWYPAAALLRINPTDPTALAIIRARLDPNVDLNEKRQAITRIYEGAIDAKPFEQEIRRLVNDPDMQLSGMARKIAKNPHQPNN